MYKKVTFENFQMILPVYSQMSALQQTMNVSTKRDIIYHKMTGYGRYSFICKVSTINSIYLLVYATEFPTCKIIHHHTGHPHHHHHHHHHRVILYVEKFLNESQIALL